MNRTGIKLLLPVIPLLILACASTPESTASKSAGLTFIHLNDTYRIADVEDGTRGGFARAITVIRQAQSEGRDVRILHGGDFLYPSLESQLWNGRQMVEALNYLDSIAPLYLTAGNHEFDRSTPEHLISAVRASEFDWLGDNYYFNTGAADVDSVIRPVFTYEHAGKTIGIFSLTLEARDGGNERDYVEVGRNYATVAEWTIEQLDAQGVDMIIGLTHLHMTTDVQISRFRSAHPNFEFIVGGHEHEVQHQKQSEKAAAIFKGSSNARDIWRIDVDFDEQGNASTHAVLLPLDTTVAKDEGYAKIADDWRRKLIAEFPDIEEKLGEAGGRFNVTEEFVRNEESGWANFLVDQSRGAYGEARADLAYINSGSVRIDDFIAGDITREDVERTFGFPSQVRRFSVTGAEFTALLEAGYRGGRRGEGYFPQISGFRVCVDYNLPDYSRIVSLQLTGTAGWSEIVFGQAYTVVVPDFLFGDQDGYVMPQSARDSASPIGPEIKQLVLDAIAEHSAKGEKIGQKADPANPRFVRLGPDRETCWSAS